MPAFSRIPEPGSRVQNIHKHRSVTTGAGGGHRTLMMLPSQDFESCASANSATPAVRTLYNKNKFTAILFFSSLVCDRIKGLHTIWIPVSAGMTDTAKTDS